ncbi:ubiquitin carboxyl-terminal hydrolase, family 1 protein [Babesia divergens]|uniref:Ubiquitin carboxyl-terminal hydrolase n=1 Tax=Babesia divergens TaxID=32595 RepID=A0AAD9GFW5_BABDI|nr:ubiquitin carboxyl-terminal hydrolase, family 1 protein [Babesia divergens]
MVRQHFTPLESNPDVFRSYAEDLGRKDLVFQDLLAFEEWAFDMIVKWRHAHYTKDKAPETPSNVWFTCQVSKREDKEQRTQKVSNACGTIALLHLLNNIVAAGKIDENSSIEHIKKSTLKASPQERGEVREAKCNVHLKQFIEKSNQINELHQKFQNKGDTEALPTGTRVDTHFITFVVVEDHLYELVNNDAKTNPKFMQDGTMPYPINHGPSSPENFVVVRQNLHESICAIA